MSRRAGGRGKKADKPKEYGNEKFLDFVKTRFELLQDELDEYISSQGLRAASLLKFKGLDISSGAREEGDEEEAQAEKNLNELKDNSRRVEQQVRLIRSIASKVEKDLYLSENDASGLSSDEKQELRLKTIQEEQELYKNLEFNMNYQLRQNQSYNPYGYYSNQQMQFFECNSEYSQKTLIQMNQHVQIRTIQSQLLDDKDKNIQNLIMNIPLFNDESDYFKFDDLLNSSFIDRENTFNQIWVNVSLENNLSALSFLRFLLTIKSCNLLKIAVTSPRVEEKYENISNVLETIFQVILSIKNLQGLTVTAKHIIMPYLVAGIRKVDPTQSSLRAVYLQGDMRLANTNEIAEMLKYFANVPGLYDFQADQLVVSGAESEKNFSDLLQRVKQINVKLHQIPRSFSFDLPLQNIVSLKLIASFEPNQFNLRLLDTFLNSVKRAQSLAIFSLTIGQEVNHLTSRKDILRDALVAKQEVQEESKETEGETSAAAAAPLAKLELFNHLSELSNLKNFVFQSEGNQHSYDSILKLLIRNGSLQKVTVRQNQNNEANPLKKLTFDFKNINEILNNLKNIQQFTLNAFGNEIAYSLPNKLSTQYHFRQSYRSINEYVKYNPAFSFDRVNQVDVSLLFQGYEALDNLCTSIASCPNISKINIQVSSFQHGVDISQLQKKATNDAKLLHFKRLETLKKLQHFKLSLYLDQQILDSIESVVRNVNSLKSLVLKREYFASQLYLNYTGLLGGLMGSKSIEQVYLQTNIEQNVVTEASAAKWAEVQLENLYRPAAELIRNAPAQLTNIDLDEQQCNEDGHLLILRALNASPHMVYMKFHGNLLREFLNKKEEIVSEFNKASQDGKLVNPSFRFPLIQGTFQGYSYW